MQGSCPVYMKCTLFLRKYQTLLFLLLFSLGAIFYNIWSSEQYLSVLIHFTIILTIGSASFFLLRIITKKKRMFSNTLITLLILALLLHPVNMMESYIMAGVAAIIGMLIKYFGEYKGSPIVNPVIGAILLGSLISFTVKETGLFFLPSWWGATFFLVDIESWQIQISLVLLVLWAIVGLRTYKKLLLPVVFLPTLFLGIFLLSHDSSFLRSFFTDATIYFFALIMLVDPKTSPIKKDEQIYFGFGIGTLATLLYMQDTWMYAQEQYFLTALALGNIFLFGRKLFKI